MLPCCQMTTRVEFAEWLQGEMDNRGISAAELSRRSKVDKGAISRTLKGERMPSGTTLAAIAKGLGIPQAIVFEKAGIMDPNPEMDPWLESTNEKLAKLPPEDQDDIHQLIDAIIEARMNRRKRGPQPQTE